MVRGLLEDAFVMTRLLSNRLFTVSKRGRTYVVVKLTGTCWT